MARNRMKVPIVQIESYFSDKQYLLGLGADSKVYIYTKDGWIEWK
jgi:hypothetical protein